MSPKDKGPLARILASRTGEWLLAHVEEWHERSEKPRVDPGWFHPSSLSHPCDAHLGFEFMGVKPQQKFTARTLRIFDLGTGRHKDWGRYLRLSKASIVGPDCSLSFSIPNLCIRGECDDIIKNPLTGEISIFELKTMNSFQWKGLRIPLGDHMTQVHAYMAGKGIPATLIVYENKDTQEPKEFLVRFDAPTWDRITERTQRIRAQIEEGVVPERRPARNESSCRFYHCCSTFDMRKFRG